MTAPTSAEVVHPDISSISFIAWSGLRDLEHVNESHGPLFQTVIALRAINRIANANSQLAVRDEQLLHCQQVIAQYQARFSPLVPPNVTPIRPDVAAPLADSEHPPVVVPPGDAAEEEVGDYVYGEATNDEDFDFFTPEPEPQG